jgi:class 3 adenylate cyclase
VVPPAAFERQLRRLRFDDPAREREFQHGYASRRVGEFPLVFWVGLAIQVPISIRFVLIEHIGLGDALFWLRLAVGVIPALVGLLLLRSSHAVRWAPTYMEVYVLLIGATLVVIYAHTDLGWAFLSTYLIAACIMAQLPTRQAATVAGALLGWYAVFATAFTDRAAASLVRSLASTLTSVLFILVAAYLIERSARRDYVLLGLLASEREKSERLLLNVLPAVIAERLKESSETVADSFDEVTVLFADLVDSAPHIGATTPERAVELLNEIFTGFDRLTDRHGLEKIKTVGDAYMVVGGLPEATRDHATRVVAMAVDMLATMEHVAWPDGDPVQLRIGINTGPVVAGVIGTRKFAYDLWGDTVNVASRMESHGTPGAIQLTASTRRHVAGRYRLTPRTVDVKGKGPMRVYVVDPAATSIARQRPKPRATVSTAGRAARSG